MTVACSQRDIHPELNITTFSTVNSIWILRLIYLFLHLLLIVSAKKKNDYYDVIEAMFEINTSTF